MGKQEAEWSVQKEARVDERKHQLNVKLNVKNTWKTLERALH